MQTVPSLIGTGTVVAAAAAGLVFGQPSDSTASRPTSNKRKLATGFESQRLPASSRPGTSAAVDVPPPSLDYHPRSSFQQHTEPLPGPLSSHPPITSRPPLSTSSQITPPKSTSRRQSFIRQTDLTSRPIAENARDSVSSNGSWMRRLSIRPLSQHGSPRSSVFGPDSPSLIFSQTSGAPMLSPSGSGSPQLPPNKLIKRSPSGQNTDTVGTIGRGQKSQVPTFRRPATSHQRSATLQQYQQQGGFSEPPHAPKYSLDQTLRPRAFTTKAEVVERPDPQQLEPSGWTSFFHFRITKTGRVSSGSPNSVSLPNKRIESSQQVMPRACLVKPTMLSGAATGTSLPTKTALGAVEARNENGDARHVGPDLPSSPEDTPSKRARRSISMHFGSPGNWISKTGSIRRPKRGSSGAKNEGKRHVSAPTSTKQNPVQPDVKPVVDETLHSREPRPQLGPESASNYHPKARKRNSSSPLPQISRLSSFNIDVSHLDLPTTPSSGPQRPNQMPVTYFSNSRTSTSPARSRGVEGEGASTVTSSDLETRDCASGDDDDTDFKSDIMFDSFRTAGSNRLRNVETPLESMFDESPPSTAGNSRTKRLSIQEILGQSWDSDTKIMEEEDESAPTPSRTIRADVRTDVEQEPFRPVLGSPEISLSNRDFGRLSLDDDDDEDWARDEENGLINHLFPPSSSLNLRRANPRLRHALASISGNSSLDSRHLNTVNERPRSNIFDWTEPVLHEKLDIGQSPRPKTVHGKQEMDLRGGRPANRKGPGAGHVRSQSVPVVPEPTDGGSKTVPKFGTWGLGTKAVSEDWDDDFDFDEEMVSPVGAKDSATSFSMVVPASIQATQPTVKAHSGQIRELSLLVNDLKRLCRHGKDLDILDGHCSSKWKEAQNIIELASPDEDEDEDENEVKAAATNGPTKDQDAMTIDERFIDEGFDASSLDRTEDPFSSPQPEMAKNAVVRERQAVRRRSVFSPEDDIFGGNWPLSDEQPLPPTRPRTPEQSLNPNSKSAMISTVMEAMQQQRSTCDPVQRRSPVKPSQSKLFFDTNSLQELVKKAGQLRDSLSDVVRRAELLTQSPAGTPRRERVPRLGDGSPAFTRVFTDPASSPPKRLPKSHSNNSVMSRTSVDSPRLQMMTVN